MCKNTFFPSFLQKKDEEGMKMGLMAEKKSDFNF